MLQELETEYLQSGDYAAANQALELAADTKLSAEDILIEEVVRAKVGDLAKLGEMRWRYRVVDKGQNPRDEAIKVAVAVVWPLCGRCVAVVVAQPPTDTCSCPTAPFCPTAVAPAPMPHTPALPPKVPPSPSSPRPSCPTPAAAPSHPQVFNEARELIEEHIRLSVAQHRSAAGSEERGAQQRKEWAAELSDICQGLALARLVLPLRQTLVPEAQWKGCEDSIREKG